MKRKSPIRHHVHQHLRQRRPVRSYERGRGSKPFFVMTKRQVMKIFKRTRPDPTLLRLFKLQDRLIEHKFPTSNYAEYILSSAGDIYREMTNSYPHYTYVDEKISDVGALTFFGMERDRWTRVKEYQSKPDYKMKRDKYIKNLDILEAETRKANIKDPKRKEIMLESLNMIRELIKYYEGSKRFQPIITHRAQVKLQDMIYDYFPKEVVFGGKTVGRNQNLYKQTLRSRLIHGRYFNWLKGRQPTYENFVNFYNEIIDKVMKDELSGEGTTNVPLRLKYAREIGLQKLDKQLQEYFKRMSREGKLHGPYPFWYLREIKRK